MLSFINQLGGPLMHSIHYAYVPPVLGSPALDPAPQVCLTKAEERERFTSLDLLAMLFLVQPRRLLAAFVAGARCCLTVSLLSIRTPQSLLFSL